MRNFQKTSNNQNSQAFHSGSAYQEVDFRHRVPEKEMFCLSPSCITKLKQSHLRFHEEIHAKNNTYPQIEVKVILQK